jgi:hypothetical protein
MYPKYVTDLKYIPDLPTNITLEESRGHVLCALLKLKISCLTPVFGSTANHVSSFFPIENNKTNSDSTSAFYQHSV